MWSSAALLGVVVVSALWRLYFDVAAIFARTRLTHAVPAVALCGGAALYLVGHVAFLFRATGRIFRRRTLGAVVLLALGPVALTVPALVSSALVSVVRSLVVAYEALR